LIPLNRRNQIGRINKNTIGIENALLAIFAPIIIPVKKQPNKNIRIAFLEMVYFPILKDIIVF